MFRLIEYGNSTHALLPSITREIKQYRPDNQYCVFVPTPRSCFGTIFDGLKHVALITLLQTVAMTGPSDRALRRAMLTSKPKRLDDLKTRSDFVREHPFKIELLNSLVFLEKSSNALPELVRHDNKQLASLYTSYTKDVRDVIKSNGDRVFNSITDLSHTVTELMASRKEMDKTLVKSLQVTTSTLQDMLSTVSKIVRKAFGPRQQRPATPEYTKADTGGKTTHRRQNSGRLTSMPNRHRTRSETDADTGKKATHSKQTKLRRTRKQNRHRSLSETDTDTGRKATHSKQTKERRTRMSNRHRSLSETDADNDRKATHSKQTKERRTRMQNRHHHRTLSETDTDNGRNAILSKQTKERRTRKQNRHRSLSETDTDNGRKADESRTGMPNRHRHHTRFAKGDNGYLKSIPKQQNNKIMYPNLHQLQIMLSVISQATPQAKVEDRPVRHARDGHSDTEDYGSKVLIGHKRRSYADPVTFLHSYNPDTFDNTLITDFQ